MFGYLQSILGEPWKPVSRPTLVAWLVFYIPFLAYACSAHGTGLFIDNANLVVHEGGHNLFGWFGPTLGLWGGTLLQWLVPLLLAAYFFKERQTAGFVFFLFFFFENWLYTATYMADARAWFGITDVLEELHGANSKGYAVAWLGDQPNADRSRSAFLRSTTSRTTFHRSSRSTETRILLCPMSRRCACTRHSM